ncbi:MAG: aspartate aminotransferase family protein [Thermodesulfobacteriota bacterium]|jgi:4-aminobutyrate aminotransferase
MDSTAINQKHKEFLFPCVANYYSTPLPLKKGEGCYVYDWENNKYLDFFGGILTVSIGHCQPEIVKEVEDQIHTLQHASTLYPNYPMVALAEKLSQITPGKLKKSFFTNSGTEANEMAILTAQLYTGAREIVALRHSYHGRSYLAMTLTGHASWRVGGNYIPGITHAPSPYCFRCEFAATYPNCEIECAKDIEELIRTTTSGKIAAFIAEPIQGVGGFITPPKEYFKIAVEIIRRFGGLFISDEVQTGFGRTGGKWFGIEHWGVEPDLMTFAKGLANGVPIGVTIATQKAADSFKASSISTFGGNPVSTRGALATLKYMEDHDIVNHVEKVGNYFKEKLIELKDKYPLIGDVRGKGLMIGLELVKEKKEPAVNEILKVFENTKKRGLLIGKGGLYGNVVRLSPPMTVDKSGIDEAIRILDQAFAEI